MRAMRKPKPGKAKVPPQMGGKSIPVNEAPMHKGMPKGKGKKK